MARSDRYTRKILTSGDRSKWSDLYISDNNKIILGVDSDLQIYHDGTDNHIEATSALNIATANSGVAVKIGNSTSEVSISDNLTVTGDLTVNGTTTTINSTIQVGVDGTGHDVIFRGGTSGRFLHWDESADRLQLADNTTLYLGSGFDLGFFHNGTNSEIVNNTGDLTIKNQADDKDIIFQSDDGSGGTETYFFLDGNAGGTNPTTIFPDNARLAIGSGQDLKIYHSPSISYIEANNELRIRQTKDDADILFQSDDGSGGVTTYMQLDGSHKRVVFPNDIQATFGSSSRLSIKHDGTDATIMETQGDLKLINTADDKDIIFQSDDGSGGTTAYLTLDGSTKYARFSDNIRVTLGDSDDLQIKHDATDSDISNYTGDLYIQNHTNDKDIIFKCDDGSGGNTAYLTLDGSSTKVKFNVDTKWTDNDQAMFGNGEDLRIYHDGSDSKIAQVGTGDLYIQNSTDDKDIIFQSDDGSGGLATYFLLDGSQASSNYYYTRFPDKSSIVFGDSNDLRVYHDNTDSSIENETGNLYIQQKADNKDIIFRCDDGSGGVETYLFLDGSIGGTVVPDGKNIYYGTGFDLAIGHTGSQSVINHAGTGNLTISTTTDDADIIFQSDDGSGGVETYLFLDGSTGQTRFPDGKKAAFGTGGDLQVYHDGNHSYIDQGTNGALFIRQTVNDQDIIFQCDDGSGGLAEYIRIDGSTGYVRFEDNRRITVGSSDDFMIYHDGTDTKLSNVTGTLQFHQNVNDSDIMFLCDDGSGGTTAYLTLDGGLGYTVAQKGVKHEGFLWLPDSKYLYVGSGNDLRIHHNSSDSYISQEGTGSLIIRNTTNDEDIIFQSDDGSGGTTAYMTIDGGDTDIKVHKNFEIEKTLTMQHTADPSDPATGHSVMWSDTSGNLKVKINVGGSVVTRTLATGTD